MEGKYKTSTPFSKVTLPWHKPAFKSTRPTIHLPTLPTDSLTNHNGFKPFVEEAHLIRNVSIIDIIPSKRHEKNKLYR